MATDLHEILQEQLYGADFAALGPNVQALLRAMDARAAMIAEFATRGPDSIGVGIAKPILRERMRELFEQFEKRS
jgi:hypothetical protein